MRIAFRAGTDLRREVSPILAVDQNQIAIARCARIFQRRQIVVGLCNKTRAGEQVNATPA